MFVGRRVVGIAESHLSLFSADLHNLQAPMSVAALIIATRGAFGRTSPPSIGSDDCNRRTTVLPESAIVL